MDSINYDQTEKLTCGSVIQHGPNNNRIYLMKTGERISPALPKALIDQARRVGYTKLFAKVPNNQYERFKEFGFTEEAHIPCFFRSGAPLFFMAFFLSDERRYEPDKDRFTKIIQYSRQQSNPYAFPKSHNDPFVRKCQKSDIDQMVSIYRTVFESYPFPIHDPDFLADTMESNVAYFGIENQGHLIALGSAEIDKDSCTAEMTDFATLPQWRGNGLASKILSRMESVLEQKGITSYFTIARAASYGMNITFSKSGYAFGGRLKNNTNISGTIESMNIWYKNDGLRQPSTSDSEKP